MESRRRSPTTRGSGLGRLVTSAMMRTGREWRPPLPEPAGPGATNPSWSSDQAQARRSTSFLRSKACRIAPTSRSAGKNRFKERRSGNRDFVGHIILPVFSRPARLAVSSSRITHAVAAVARSRNHAGQDGGFAAGRDLAGPDRGGEQQRLAEVEPDAFPPCSTSELPSQTHQDRESVAVAHERGWTNLRRSRAKYGRSRQPLARPAAGDWLVPRA